MLELEGESVEIWGVYVASLKSNLIFIKEDEEDSLFWIGNDKSVMYTIKLGYKLLEKEEFTGYRKWWCNFI
jgi:hypothetical protein